MKMLVFSIEDKVAGAFMQPFFMHTKGQASRSFGDLVSNKDSMVSKHPNDYRLFCIGEYDDETGDLKNSKNEFIINGSDFVERS